jgi:hypothetical protein
MSDLEEQVCVGDEARAASGRKFVGSRELKGI